MCLILEFECAREGKADTQVVMLGGLRVKSRAGKGRMALKGEMRGKVPLMILNQTQPFPVP